jgi:hypothetical protein
VETVVDQQDREDHNADDIRFCIEEEIIYLHDVSSRDMENSIVCSCLFYLIQPFCGKPFLQKKENPRRRLPVRVSVAQPCFCLCLGFSQMTIT